MDNSNADFADFVPTLFAETDRYRLVARLHDNALSIGFYATEQDASEDGWDVKGYLRWDGCLNWMTDPNCYAHLCDPEDIAHISAIFEAVGKLAIEHMPKYEGNFGRALAAAEGGKA